MFSLVEQCLRGKKEAWADLWLIYDHVAAQPVRRLLVRAGFDSSEADDVAIEVFERLWDKKCKRLRSFRGESEVELANWLIHLAMNFTRNWIDRRWRAMKRERRAMKGLHAPNRTGPTEEEITALFQELDQIASSEDMNRLRKITGLSGSLPSQSTVADIAGERPSERTERLWIKDLVEKLQKGDWTPRHRKQKHTPPKGQRPREKSKGFIEFSCRLKGDYLSSLVAVSEVITFGTLWMPGSTVLILISQLW